MITSYKEAGVNIEEGYRSVKLIKEYAAKTMSEYVLMVLEVLQEWLNFQRDIKNQF